MTTGSITTDSQDAEGATDHYEDDWQRAHRELMRIADTRARMDVDEARWLAVAAREGTHARLGYATFVEYIERLFGYSPRFTLERLRVAEALEHLPKTAEALRDGSFGWSAVRELTRVAVPETEEEWLVAAMGKTARDVEKLVSGYGPGSRPSDLPDPSLRRHVIRLEVSGETLAVFRDAMAKVRRDAGAPLDNDATVLMLARCVLAGPIDEGRASYQVSLSVCERCRRGFQSGRGSVVEVDADVVAMATCDAQTVEAVDNSTHVGGSVGKSRNESSPDGNATGEASGADWMTEGGCEAGTIGADSTDQGPRTAGPIGADSLNEGTGEGVGPEPVATSTDPGTMVAGGEAGDVAGAPKRVGQSIPPAARRHVLVRDERRCRVPGCRNAVFLDVHHVESRGEGGRHDVENLVTLCVAHHRAIHRGILGVRRNREGALAFEHADGTPYGSACISARLIDARARAFRALRSLGYRDAESRAALDQAVLGVGNEPTIEMLLRLALRALSDAA